MSKQKKSTRKNNQLMILALVGAVTLAVVFGGLMLVNNGGDDEGANAPPVAESALVTEDAWKITADGATVTIVEFLDLECEACRAAHPNVKQVLDTYEGKVNYVVRQFTNHNNSVLAAKAAEAAGEQGKYWEMVDTLFTRQPEWGEQKDSQAPLFSAYAAELGLDIPAFEASMASDKYLDKIAADKLQAQELGVNATPTFYINGTKIVGVLSVSEMSSRIDAELNK